MKVNRCIEFNKLQGFRRSSIYERLSVCMYYDAVVAVPVYINEKNR